METKLIFILLLVVFGHVSNASMDALAHNFQGTIYARWKDASTWFGRFINWWAGPEAHTNKHVLDDHPIWGPILSWALLGPLAFLFSAWHFSKMLFLTAYQVAIIVALPDYIPGSVDFFLLLGLFKLIGGIAFQLSYPNPRTKFKEVFERQPSALKPRNELVDLILQYPKRVTGFWVTFCTIGGAYTFSFTGGNDFDYPHIDTMGFSDWSLVAWMVICAFGLYYIQAVGRPRTT